MKVKCTGTKTCKRKNCMHYAAHGPVILKVMDVRCNDVIRTCKYVKQMVGCAHVYMYYTATGIKWKEG